jgi:hypothetical protein
MKTVENPEWVKLVSRPRSEPGFFRMQVKIFTSVQLVTIRITYQNKLIFCYQKRKYYLFPVCFLWNLPSLGSPVLSRRSCAHLTSDVPTLSSHFQHLPRILPLQSLMITRLCLALYEGPIWLHHVSFRTGELLCRCQTIVLRPVSHWIHKGIIKKFVRFSLFSHAELFKRIFHHSNDKQSFVLKCTRAYDTCIWHVPGDYIG